MVVANVDVIDSYLLLTIVIFMTFNCPSLQYVFLFVDDPNCLSAVCVFIYSMCLTSVLPLIV